MKYKHNPNKVLEACAETLKKEMCFNPKQFLRYFMLFPLAGYEEFLDVPSKEYENWYELKGKPLHIKLLYNYVTKEYVLLYPESDWKDNWMVDELKKSEEELVCDKELYAKRMEEIINTTMYKKIKSLIEWYFSCPIPSARRAALLSPMILY